MRSCLELVEPGLHDVADRDDADQHAVVVDHGDVPDAVVGHGLREVVHARVGGQVCTCAVIRLDTGSVSSTGAPLVQPPGDVALGHDALHALPVGGDDERADAVLGEQSERGAHALGPGDGGDVAALVAQQLADLHGQPPRGTVPGVSTRVPRRGQRWRRVRPTVEGCSGQRPNPLQWVRYALGGGLPRELSPWVLADTTGRTWIVRHLVRAVVQMLPVVVLCLLVPVPLAYRVSAAAGGLLLGLLFSMAFMTETIEHRVAQGRLSAGDRRPGAGRARRARPGRAALPLPPGRRRAASTDARQSTRNPTFSRTWK